MIVAYKYKLNRNRNQFFFNFKNWTGTRTDKIINVLVSVLYTHKYTGNMNAMTISVIFVVSLFNFVEKLLKSEQFHKPKIQNRRPTVFPSENLIYIKFMTFYIIIIGFIFIFYQNFRAMSNDLLRLNWP